MQQQDCSADDVIFVPQALRPVPRPGWFAGPARDWTPPRLVPNTKKVLASKKPKQRSASLLQNSLAVHLIETRNDHKRRQASIAYAKANQNFQALFKSVQLAMYSEEGRQGKVEEEKVPVEMYGAVENAEGAGEKKAVGGWWP